MSAPEATAPTTNPLRCPACQSDKTVCTWTDPDEADPTLLDVRRRCERCGQGYRVVYACVSITPTGVVR